MNTTANEIYGKDSLSEIWRSCLEDKKSLFMSVKNTDRVSNVIEHADLEKTTDDKVVFNVSPFVVINLRATDEHVGFIVPGTAFLKNVCILTDDVIEFFTE